MSARLRSLSVQQGVALVAISGERSADAKSIVCHRIDWFQRQSTQTGRAALANMPLLTALLPAALAGAETTPAYCGRAGSGADAAARAGHRRQLEECPRYRAPRRPRARRGLRPLAARRRRRGVALSRRGRRGRFERRLVVPAPQRRYGTSAGPGELLEDGRAVARSGVRCARPTGAPPR